MSAEPVDLRSIRLSRALKRLDGLRAAQRGLHTSGQLDGSLEVLRQVGTPHTLSEAALLTDALDLAVDAMCNQNDTARARALAEEKLDEIHQLSPNRPQKLGPIPLGRAPRILPAFRASRILARAIELDGDPSEAVSRLMGLHKSLSRSPEIGVGAHLESVLILRGVLSSAKREGSQLGRYFADLARKDGDQFLTPHFCQAHADAAASYMHRAAIERRAHADPQAQSEAATLFERSLKLRQNTARDLRTRGMAIGDLLVLRGHRERGVKLLSKTVEGFQNALPRHYESARQQLIERDLLRVA